MFNIPEDTIYAFLDVPPLRGGVGEAVVTRWVRRPGNMFSEEATFEKDEPLVELSTGDVVKAPHRGSLRCV